MLIIQHHEGITSHYVSTQMIYPFVFRVLQYIQQFIPAWNQDLSHGIHWFCINSHTIPLVWSAHWKHAVVKQRVPPSQHVPIIAKDKWLIHIGHLARYMENKTYPRTELPASVVENVFPGLTRLATPVDLFYSLRKTTLVYMVTHELISMEPISSIKLKCWTHHWRLLNVNQIHVKIDLPIQIFSKTETEYRKLEQKACHAVWWVHHRYSLLSVYNLQHM